MYLLFYFCFRRHHNGYLVFNIRDLGLVHERNFPHAKAVELERRKKNTNRGNGKCNAIEYKIHRSNDFWVTHTYLPYFYWKCLKYVTIRIDWDLSYIFVYSFMKLKDMFKKGQISSDYPKKICLQNLGLGQACSYPYYICT